MRERTCNASTNFLNSIMFISNIATKRDNRASIVFIQFFSQIEISFVIIKKVNK